MSKRTEALDRELDVYDTDIADDDYGFILSADGELKSVFLPDVIPEDLPENIQKLLAVFGILDISDLDTPQTLH